MYRKKRNIVMKVSLGLFGGAVLCFSGFALAMHLFGNEIKAKSEELISCQEHIARLQNEIKVLTEPPIDSRQVYVDSVELHDFVFTGDYVDIRSVDEEGTDRIVLEGIEVVSVVDKGFILSMTEKEIKELTLSTVKLQNGDLVKQYAVRYPE